MNNKTIKLILKITISGIAVYYVASKLDFHMIWNTMKSAKISLLLVALLFYALSQFVAASRLNCLFRRISLKISTKANIKLYWLGLFYNLFLPGGVGGDGFKIFLLGKYLKTDVKKIIWTVLSDRVSGLSVILIFLMFFAYFIDYRFPLQNWVWATIPFIILAFYLFLRKVNSSFISAFIPVFNRAVVVQILQMITALMIMLSLNIGLGGKVVNYLFLFFLSSIAGSVPFTLGGVGAREATFMWGAGHLGIDETSAVALSLIFYAVSVITAFPGIVYTRHPADILNETNCSTVSEIPEKDQVK